MKLPSEILPGPSYDVEKHLVHVQKLFDTYPYNESTACIAKVRQLAGDTPEPMRRTVEGFLADLLQDNDIFVPDKPTLQHEPYLSRMQRRFTLNAERAFNVVSDFLAQLYTAVPAGPGTFAIPISDCFDADDLIGYAFQFFDAKDGDEYLFPDLRRKLYENLVRASGFEPSQYDGKRKLTYPRDSNLPKEQKLAAYLRDTPFLELFAASVPFAIPRKAYTEHGAIFAPSGHGKTQLLQHMISGFLDEPDPPAMFIIDSQGSMLRRIERLAVFADRLKDRLVVLEPPEPALNFFQFDGTNMEVLELAGYLFAALDRQLTAKQGTAIPYLLKLLQQIPDATLDTLREIMDDKSKFEASPYYDHIMRLDERSQSFFRHQFFGQEMKATRQQVSNRLYTILGNEAFVKMFAAKENRFNAFDAMRQKKIVLVNTSQRVLGETASAVFGRFIIAQVLAAAYQRDPDANNHLALIIVDEAFEYFDEKTERILSQARKYGVGLLFASQYLEQMPPGVKAAVNATTAIKLAGPISYNDAMMLGREMHAPVDFLRSMRAVDRSHAEFACFVRNLTPHAIKVAVPYGTLEKRAQMDPATLTDLRARNRERYGPSIGGRTSVPTAERTPKTVSSPAAEPPPVVHDPSRAVDK